jgi:hypothetical protein
MRKLALAILLVLFAFSTVWAVGKVTITSDNIFIDQGVARKVVTLSWIGDSGNGTIPTITIDANTYKITGWYLYSVETNPGSVAPTDDYDIVINDADGLDIVGGLLANRDVTNTELILVGTATHGYPVVRSDLSVVWSNQAVHSATGTLILTFVSN